MGLIEQILDAGVTGAGGAGFPADIKLNTEAEVFIVNGIECEPLLRTDRHIMELYSDRLSETVLLIKDHLKAKRAVIALKSHYEKAVEKIKSSFSERGIEVYLSDSFYPAGDEQNLVFSVTGRVVPTGGIPLDVGCVVSNVGTVLLIADAIDGIPFTDKLVTVSGCVKRPVTLSCPVGTPVSTLIEAAGGAEPESSFIMGGPLMGSIITDLSAPVTKTTGGVLAIPKRHTLLSFKEYVPEKERILARAACSQCSMCTQMCPRNSMGLKVEPHKVMRAFALGDEALLNAENGVFSCCDCGICTYFACNFSLKPSKAMQQAKAMLASSGVRPIKEVKHPPDRGFEQKRLPTKRLINRLDLLRLDKDTEFIGEIHSGYVKLPLKMHVGSPSEPVVKKGMKVKKGEPVAKTKGMGALIHASISGTVINVTDEFIEIKE